MPVTEAFSSLPLDKRTRAMLFIAGELGTLREAMASIDARVDRLAFYHAVVRIAAEQGNQAVLAEAKALEATVL